MAVGGEHGGAGGVKNIAKAQKRPKVVKKAPGPPNFPKLVPVRPGAPTPKGATKPSTQAQRTHVHEARVQRARVVQKAQAQHDVPTDKDLAVAQAFNEAHPAKPKVEKKKGGFAGLITGAGELASKAAPVLADVAMGPVAASGHFAVQKATGLKILPTIHKIAKNAPIDAAELAVTTPSSLAKLGTTAVHDPEKVPGMLVEPYKQLAKHPGKFITEHPVSTALMVQPAVRMPGRVAGRVARVAGKQTLSRAPKTLPGTPLKEARTASRDVVVNTLQKRADRKAGAQRMSDAEIQRRADEFFDVGQQHKQRVVRSATKEAKRRFKDMPKAERQAAGEEHVSGARGGAREQVDKTFVERFGSTWQVTPEGVVLKPKTATKGVLHDNKGAADLIADRVPFEATVKQVGEKYGVVPKVATERLARHNTVGTSPAIGAKVFRTAGKTFRSAVLPFSAKWLTGQGVEAGGVRAPIAGAGPTSFLREHKVFKAMEQQNPGSGIEMRQNTSSGGQFGLTGTAREFADGTKTLAEEFEGTGLSRPAKALTKAGSVPPVKQVRRGFRAYSRFVFDGVNGAIETTTQRAMTGKAIKQGPLMERSIIGLTDKAIQDAARGLQHTENQVAAGRAVQRMYGQYSKFSPEKRETLLHTTPFYPWYRNVVTFLTKTLPVDHPVKTALLADLDATTEEWRKVHGLSLRGGKRRPGFLLGGYPTGAGNQIVRVGRYTPFSPGDPVGSVADLALPQFAGVRDNLVGIDFTGKPIKGNRLLNAGATALETHVPGVSQAGRITGLTDRYIRKKDEPSVLQGKDLAAALRREVDPLISTKGGSETSGKPKRKVARKQHDILGGSSAGTVDILR